MKLALLALPCLLLAGCHITTHDEGGKKNVDIGTPFGSMKVNTNEPGDTSAIGLTVYPGASPVKEEKGSDGNANIDMSFGSFHLGVRAASFHTPDSEDKVLAFYRKDLARYGDIITCKGNTSVGSPTHTSQGLTCDSKGKTRAIVTHDKDGLHINDGSADSLELRAGSPQHQHIVGLEPEHGGIKIGLVALDLPKDSRHTSSESE